MPNQSFHAETIAHLLDYKSRNAELSGLAAGTYNYQGSLIDYPHILPWESRFLNFLPEYRPELTALVESCPNKLNQYFHHLNSSQAMCLNFFLPLQLEKKLEWVLEILDFPDETIDYQTACFEKDGIDGCHEKGWRSTSFDYYFETTTGKKFYFEIKYTEDRFGTKPEKERNESMEKFETIYLPLLKETIRPECLVPELFFDNYQIMRNLCHLRSDSYVVFLYPMGNWSIGDDAESVNDKFLLPEYHDHFRTYSWGLVCGHLKHKALTQSKLHRQIEAFIEKYFPTRKR